jgi:5-formyltetrahydrofolate cyclo-ligase
VDTVAVDLRRRGLRARQGPGPGDDGVRFAKHELRTALLSERARVPAGRQLAVARGLRDTFLELPALRHARCVATYLARPGEPGMHLLQEALALRGVSVVTPVIDATAQVRWRSALHVADPHRSLARRPPVRSLARRRREEGAVPPRDIAVAIVPALAVDTEGRRIGRGQDQYDRILGHLEPATLVLAAVLDEELFDSAVEPIPEEPHDVRIDAALTPTRIHYLRSPRVVSVVHATGNRCLGR